MKILKKAFVLMTFISLMFCLSNLVFALDKEVKVTVQRGNVRVKPSLQSTVIGRVPLGASFKVLETEGEWFKISLPPDEDGFVISGYIHSSVVEVSEVEKAEENIENEKESKKAKRKKEAKTQEGDTSPPPPPSEPQYEQPPARSGGMGFGFKLSGGGSYLMLGNLNQFFTDRNTWLNDTADSGTLTGSYPSFHLGFGGGAEFILYFTPNIGVGVGADFLTASYSSGELAWKDSFLIFTWDYTESTDITLTAIPVKLSLHFTLPMGSSMNLAFNLGGGYYLGTFKQDMASTGVILIWPYSNQDEVTASPSTFGFHGGLGFEFNVSPGIALCLDIQGRYARFTEITGTYKWSNLGGSGEEERTLYTYNYGPSDEYLGYNWAATIPADGEAATVDLSGIDFKFGVKITF